MTAGAALSIVGYAGSAGQARYGEALMFVLPSLCHESVFDGPDAEVRSNECIEGRLC